MKNRKAVKTRNQFLTFCYDNLATPGSRSFVIRLMEGKNEQL